MKDKLNPVPWHHSLRIQWQSFKCREREPSPSVPSPEEYPKEAKRKRICNNQSKTHHFTNTTTTTGNQHDFTVDTEEILDIEGGHGYGFEKRARESAGLAFTRHGS